MKSQDVVSRDSGVHECRVWWGYQTSVTVERIKNKWYCMGVHGYNRIVAQNCYCEAFKHHTPEIHQNRIQKQIQNKSWGSRYHLEIFTDIIHTTIPRLIYCILIYCIWALLQYFSWLFKAVENFASPFPPFWEEGSPCLLTYHWKNLFKRKMMTLRKRQKALAKMAACQNGTIL